MIRKLLILTMVAMMALTMTALVSDPTFADSRDRSFGYYGWGPRIGLSVDPGQLVIGGHVDMGEPIAHLRLQPNVELGFGDNVTIIEINAPLHFRFADPIDVWSPYAGAELGYSIAFLDGGKDNADLGVKIVGGFERHLSDGDKFFLEGKIGLSDEVADWKFLVGWTFVE